jgi:hypothetical protein
MEQHRLDLPGMGGRLLHLRIHLFMQNAFHLPKVFHSIGAISNSLVQIQKQLFVFMTVGVVWLGLIGSMAFSQVAIKDSNDSTGSGLRLIGIRLVPYSRPRPGKQFIVQVNVENVSKEPKSAMVLVKIDQMPDYQAASEVHIQPNSAFSVDVHLRVPAHLKRDSPFEIIVSLNSLSENPRVLLTPKGQPMIDSLRLKVDSVAMTTVVMLEQGPPFAPEWYWPRKDHLFSYELTIASRLNYMLPRNTLTMEDGQMPCQLIEWESVDSIVLAREGPLRDAAAMESMRHWLAGGGRAWIMFDKLNEENLDAILPDSMSCQTIDDINVADFVVEVGTLLNIKEPERTVSLKDPVKMRRVIQTGGTVAHSIHGFPAAIWYQVGKGTLLVTTLDASAWLTPRIGPRDSVHKQCDFQLRDWASPITYHFFEDREMRSPIERAEVLYPLKHIGNPVLERSFVLACLLGFCALLFGAACICWTNGHLVRMGWFVPILSVCCCAPLLIASYRLRREIPDTSAHLQVVEVLPGSKSIQANQWTATYKNDAGSAVLSAKGDATVSWPDSTQHSDLRRMLWQDLQSWQLSSTGWPRGLWQLRTRFAIPPKPYEVNARLDSDGLSIRVPSTMQHAMEDTVLMYHAGDPVVCGRIESGSSVRVPDGHGTIDQSWMGSAIVDDEQSRRDEVYRQLTARGKDSAFPSYPALFGWTPLWPSPISWDDARDERGSALVVLPVQLAVVPSGETVTVPHALVQVMADNQFAISSAFHNESGLWRDATTFSQSIPLRFVLPPQVCPLKATELIFDLQMRAPQREVRLKSAASKESPLVAEMRSPQGQLRFRTSDPEILADAQDGSLRFVLEIGDSFAGEETFSGSWKVDYLRMSLRGTVQDR